MKFNAACLCALLFGSLLVNAAEPPPAAPGAAMTPRAALEDAWDDFQQALAECTRFVREHPFYQNEEDRAAAYAYLSAMTLARIEEDIVFDAEQPYFRVLDHRIREGGDNPDQRYLIATLKGGERYRVWGAVGGNRRLDLQVYAGDPSYLSWLHSVVGS